MLKEFLWRLFENTGKIDTYVVYKEIDNKTVEETGNPGKIPDSPSQNGSLTDKIKVGTGLGTP